jgi:hypothetical protein
MNEARCICGRPEDDHEAYDCYKDEALVSGYDPLGIVRDRGWYS